MTKNQKYSCADFTFPLLTHEKSLQLIRLLGFDAVDLGFFVGRSHLDPLEIGKNPEAEGKKLFNKLREIGLHTADVFLQTGPEPPVSAANNPEASVRVQNRELFRSALDFANALECRHLTGLPGVVHAGEDFSDDWHRACEEAIWRTETAKAANITYAIEPHVGSILPDSETTLQFMEDCSGLTLTLDYGHFIYQGQSNESIHPLIPYASHFHARGGASGRLQTTVKENTIDFQSILARFKEVNYAGYICLEYVYQDWEGCNKTDNVSETILLRRLLEGEIGNPAGV